MNKKIILSISLAGFLSLANAQTEKQIPEVTIASKSLQEINKSGKNITLLTQKDLEKYKGQTLSDVLERITNFQITGSFNNNSEPKTLRVRGGDNNVVILIDGIPMKDVTTIKNNVMDIRLLSLENIESIEILNGASSVLYGSNAGTAVIDIKTKKNSYKKIDAAFGMRGGSYGTFAQNADISGKLGVFNYHISGFNEKSDGLSSAEGDDSFDKDGFEKQALNAKAGISLKNFNFSLNGGWNHHLFKYDNGAFSDGENRGNDRQTYLDGNANFLYRNGQLTLNTRFSNNKRIGESFIGNSYQEQYSYEGKDFFAELFNRYDFNKNIQLTAGLQYENQKMNENENSSFDAFANALFTYKFVHLEAGTRLTNNSKFGNQWTYSANPYLYQELGSSFIKLGYSFATAFISPTLYQSFGSLPYVLPNPDLKPETSLSQEINISFGKKDRSQIMSVSMFHRKEQDVFGYYTDPFTYLGIYKNISKNTTRGFEVEFNYQLTSKIGFGGNFSFVEKENYSAMKRQPKQRVNSYIEILPFKGSRVLISHLFVGSRADAYYDSLTYSTREVILSDFNLFNASISQQINPKLSFYLNLNNILNKEYTDVVGYTTKNRNFTFGMNYRF